MFKAFRDAVRTQFVQMQQHRLYKTAVDKDTLWDAYLSAFPEGTNPMFRERTEHDCQACRAFIRNAGAIVIIDDDKMVSIWDVQVGGFYQVVADALSKLVKSSQIENIFLSLEPKAGIERNYQDTGDGVLTWDHFTVAFPQDIVALEPHYNHRLGVVKDFHQVLVRGLREITAEAIDDVLELISQNNLYRGEEHAPAVRQFKELKRQYEAASHEKQQLITWVWTQGESPAVVNIRNTVIGTLLQDLSTGVPIEAAVRSFETKVAPANYKRPKAVVTKQMLEEAKKALNDLDLLPALDRRYAVLEDITVNNVLFANSSARRRMGDVFDELINCLPINSKTLANIEEVFIESFVTDILPKTTSIEALFENRHQNNLVSLIAPCNKGAKCLFKWPNPFSWSYAGQFADSIKERVKTAGGAVDGVFAFRLAWYNYDDLDAHITEPDGYEIFYQNKTLLSPCGGVLDVDMNANYCTTREPVENITYRHTDKMREGTYVLRVQNYHKREMQDSGFEAEVQIGNETYHLEYTKPISSTGFVTVGEVTYSKKNGFTFTPKIASASRSKTLWNISTQTYHPVTVVMKSPNYWDDTTIGNEHYFFMLDNCANDGSARGVFNEFLSDTLTPHRKALELVGSKLQTATAQDQLSGLGFSSTQRNSLVLKLSGEINKTIKVVF